MSYHNLLRKVIANPEVLLLDEFPGAVGAYSLRYLSSSYTDDVILVRRSSDDAEEGFTPTEITNGTLEGFCGAGDGFVKICYDQSGNGYNLNQFTNANQPKIVSSGDIILENGNPVFDFQSDKWLESTDASLINIPDTGMTISVVSTPLTNETNHALYGFNGSDDIILYPNDTDSGDGGNRIFWRNNGINVISESGINLSGVQTLYSTIYRQDYISSYRNSTNIDSKVLSGTSNSNWVVFRFGFWGAGQFFNGFGQEIIIWDGDKESDITGIDSNINKYYNVF